VRRIDDRSGTIDQGCHASQAEKWVQVYKKEHCRAFPLAAKEISIFSSLDGEMAKE